MRTLKQIICSDLQIDPQFVSVEPSESGASSKKYYTVSGIARDRPDEIFMLMQAPADTLSDFLDIASFLNEQNIRTPRILHANVSELYVIMEYCGNQTLEKRIANVSTGMIEKYYKNVVDLLLAFQTTSPDSSCVVSTRFFDKDKFYFEHEFHLSQKLITNHLSHPLSPSEKEILDIVFETIAHELSNQPFVFVHRDFQSSNLLLKDQDLVLIDFQDARMGLPLYDLVSLMEDAYVAIQPELKRQLIDYYKTSARRQLVPIPSESNFQWIYDLTTIQRKLHDAGAFVYCFENFGNMKYVSYIDTVLQHALDVMSRYTIFNRPYELLTMINHAYLTKK